MSTTQEVTKTAIEASPSVAYATLHIMGVGLPDWVAILALIYTTLQIGHLIWRWRRAWLLTRGAEEERRGHEKHERSGAD